MDFGSMTVMVAFIFRMFIRLKELLQNAREIPFITVENYTSRVYEMGVQRINLEFKGNLGNSWDLRKFLYIYLR